MANGNFQEFRKLVLSDAALQEELVAIEGREEFIARVVALGRIHSFKFEDEDVIQALRDASRSWIERWI